RQAMDDYLNRVLADGARFKAVYDAEKARKKQAPSRNPNAYVFEARDLIYARYSKGVSRDKLAGRGRDLLALAVFLAYDNAKQEEKEVNDETLTTFFRESSTLYGALEEVSLEEGGNPELWWEEHVKLLETAILNRYLLIQSLRAQAREKLSGTGVSSQPDRLRIDGWQKAVFAHLLDLGRLYIEAANRQVAFRVKQQEEAQRGFRALAMVYQNTQSSQALKILRDANRIQRYNLWQMARMTWRQAKDAAAAGKVQEANELYFRAKMQYLETLSRLEESRKPTVVDELARLQEEIATWTRGRAAPAGG
ncbi:MAG: hypothetical protein ABIL09_22125, partial [Gemmatimonadota bacterium]